jgi:hypothetical protein
MAAMARHDGERADVSAADVSAHMSSCGDCREYIEHDLRVVASLGGTDLPRLERDLWPAVHAAIASPGGVGRRGFVAAAAVLVCWRAAQLAFDLPAPVINGLLPLSAALILLRPAIRQAFTIGDNPLQVSQERV